MVACISRLQIAATGSQLLEQLAGLAAQVAWRALQIGEALFQNRRFARVGLANSATISSNVMASLPMGAPWT
jgi:hypothetical protein